MSTYVAPLPRSLPHLPRPVEQALLDALCHNLGQHGVYRPDDIDGLVADATERCASPAMATKYQQALHARIVYAVTGTTYATDGRTD